MASVRTYGGETVWEIVKAHYDAPAGMVELVLEANPGLADHGVHLPGGLMVELPVAPAPVAPEPVRLFS